MNFKNAAYCIICHSRQTYRYQIASHAIARICLMADVLNTVIWTWVNQRCNKKYHFS